MTLRIALPIAPATETHCGQCQARSLNQCGAFHLRALEYDYSSGTFMRHRDCLSASTLPAGPWTEQRPTEAGEYELSLNPAARYEHTPAVVLVRVRVSASGRISVSSLSHDFQLLNINIQDEMFDGARWGKRQPSADPFAGGE